MDSTAERQRGQREAKGATDTMNMGDWRDTSGHGKTNFFGELLAD